MPEHKKGESRQDWMNRCIPYLIKNEGKTQEEAAGKCGGMYDSWAKEQANMSEPETYDMQNIEIFAAGKWQCSDGKIYEFPQEDLNNIVNAFNELKGQADPAIKLGHSETQELLKSGGLPSAGWLDNLRIVKDKIVADFKKIPKEIYKIIKNGGLKRVSPEVVFNYKPFPGSKIYPRFLEAVALLGVGQKAMKSLKDFVNVYSEGDVNDVALELDFETAIFSEYVTDEEIDNNNHKEVINMELKELLDETKNELKDTKVKLSESETKTKELQSNLDEITKENEALKAKNAEFKEITRKKEIESWVDSKVSEGKLPKDKRDEYVTKLSSFSEEVLEDAKGLIEMNAKVDFGEHTVDTTETDETDETKTNENGDTIDEKGAEIDKKIKAEMKEAGDGDYIAAETRLKERGEI